MNLLKINLTASFSVFYLLATGCFFFEDTKVSQAEIKKSSSWNEADQPPSFEPCADLDTEAQWTCFESEVSGAMRLYFENNPLTSQQSLEEEINISLIVNKEGHFTLEEALISNVLRNNIDGLEDALYDAVASLPKALPAIKTNVGEPVEIKFQLPLLIQAAPVSK